MKQNQKFTLIITKQEIMALAEFIDMAVKSYGRNCNLGLADYLLRKLDKDPVVYEVDEGEASGESPTPEAQEAQANFESPASSLVESGANKEGDVA